MLRKLSRKSIALPLTINNKERSINVGLIMVVVISSVITWFLAEFFVYQLDRLDLDYYSFREVRQKAMAATQSCYIDYEGGNDNNSGSKDSPWKHHPWDITLAANSNPVVNRGNCKNYYFKKGVIYRGTLAALDSGQEGSPITLDTDPSWGDGEAKIFGSERINSGWQQCTEEACAEISEGARSNVWYVDTTPDIYHIPMMAYELRGDAIAKFSIARSPNWNISNPDDPKTEWWEFTGYAFQNKLTLNDVSGFGVGDVVYNPNYSSIARGHIVITAVGANYINVATDQVATADFSAGRQITNGTVTHNVTAVSRLTSKYKDTAHLTQADSNFWTDGIIWYEDYCYWPKAARIQSYNLQDNEILFYGIRDQYANKTYHRYFIEGLPQLLDEANEWVYMQSGVHNGRIYVWLSGARNPNNTVIELARYQNFLKIEDRRYITIQNLDIKFFNGSNFYADPSGYSPRFAEGTRSRNPEYFTSVIRITRDSSNIAVLNCNIEYSNQGIGFFPDGNDKLLSSLVFNNNNIAHMEANAINGLLGENMGELQRVWSWWPPQKSRIRHIQISNNQIEDIGFRAQNWNPTGAIGVLDGEMLEVANNTVINTAAPGININNPGYWNNTKGYWEGYEGMNYPLQRVLVYNNTVTNACLMTEDMGGIEIWHGGPTYVYNNSSGNAVGSMYAHKMQNPTERGYYRTGAFAPSFYSDNGYKNYIFNNIFWGKNNDESDFTYNSVGYNDYDSIMTTVFNNTIYNTAVGIHKGGGIDNRNYYLNNLVINTGERYISDRVIAHSELDSIAYAHNIFNDHGGSIFGMLQLDLSMSTRNSFITKLAQKQSLSLDPGQEISGDQVINENNHDFHLKSTSSAIDAGKKVFIPWGLYEAAGEWGFYKNRADATKILDEHINWNKNFWERDYVQAGNVPRIDLTAYGISGADFKIGTLENWIDGALEINGENQYLSRAAGQSGLLDMDKDVDGNSEINNFLIEAVIKIPESEANGGIVEKINGGKGYAVSLVNGRVRASVKFGAASCTRTSVGIVNDGYWHHIIAEVDRNTVQGINIYIDGRLSNGDFTGAMNSSANISNSGDFVVGKSADEGYLAGTFDFLRVARGTLAQAETNITELYDWEFNGPFLRDYYGLKASGLSRDAGATEYNGTAASVVNYAPIVNAGADQEIFITNSATLSGVANDETLFDPPAKIAMKWRKISGPGTVSFDDSSSQNSKATFSHEGTYVLKLTANDGSLAASDEINVVVKPASQNSSNPAGSNSNATSNSGTNSSPPINSGAAYPVINELTPRKGNVNTQVIIKGKLFGLGKGKVLFGKIEAKTISWNDKEILALVPEALSQGEVSISVQVENMASNLISFIVLAKVQGTANSNVGQEPPKKIPANNITSLYGLSQALTENISFEEGSLISRRKELVPLNSEDKKLYLGISGANKGTLNKTNKYSIAMFIHYGTQTTQRLGSGERAGVINSYRNAFERLPSTDKEWQDVIKIANGRWTVENSRAKELSSKNIFEKIYKREPDDNNSNDLTVIKIITYGLRPINRNTESEKAGIRTFKAIYKNNPSNASDWDTVRAIAYSGAKR